MNRKDNPLETAAPAGVKPGLEPPIRINPGRGWRKRLLQVFGKPLEAMLGLPGLNRIYFSSLEQEETVEGFMGRVLSAMRVEYKVSEGDLARIPKKGRVVVVANHPFGGIEGVVIGALLHSVRPDVRIMGNYFLGLIPELRDMIIMVDNFGRETSLRKNIQPLKQCIRTLRRDQALAVFPAGEVSSLNLKNRTVADPVWSPSIAGIIRRTESPVLPVFFQGTNSALFQGLGLVHPLLRTMMLPREFLNKRGRAINLSIGGLIPFQKLSRLRRDDQIMAYLRLRTYMLKQREPEAPVKEKKLFSLFGRPGGRTKPAEYDIPVRTGLGGDLLAEEVASLPARNYLLESGKFRVYYAESGQIPRLLEEIGRLREHTFRQVGEGTGKDIDLDKFDSYYDHLFIWNGENSEIVGAYRIGRTDKIIEERGLSGLYTSSLFSFKPVLFKRLGPALEMGRSFVRPKYQKSFSPLLLLWKGICQYILKNPDYKILFGPVSISAEYSSFSQELIVRHLKVKKSLSKYAKLVKPKTPPRFKKMKRHELREFRNIFSTIDDVTEVITDIENVVKGIPVLLKQYLKLGGKILSFNVDPDFNNCLDGLILVDLTQTPPRLLANYMGKDNTLNFLNYHAAK